MLKEYKGFDGTYYIFYCPGCKIPHAYRVGSGPRPNWTFNGDMSKPTFTPSLLCNGSFSDPPHTIRCHIYLTDGVIHFLDDCEHELKGQKIPL